MSIATARSTSSGAYPLATFLNCADLYRGRHEGRSIYVVARGTAQERLFPKSDLSEAAAYARSVKASIENLPTAAQCQQAVEAVYGS